MLTKNRKCRSYSRTNHETDTTRRNIHWHSSGAQRCADYAGFYAQATARNPTSPAFFSVIEDWVDLAEWCDGLSSVIDKYDIKALLFFTSKVADALPECVSAFSDNTSIDIGSQTYSYVDLTSIPTYESALEEVRSGKSSVNRAGEVNSKIFKAPYGSADENVYSLLHRSGIIADFSYREQYNSYRNEQSVKFNMASYNWSEELGFSG